MYLGMYYKYGEYEISENFSGHLQEAMREAEQEVDEEEWDAMDEEEQWDAAMARSIQNVKRKEGWGVVDAWEGELVASTPCHK